MEYRAAVDTTPKSDKPTSLGLPLHSISTVTTHTHYGRSGTVKRDSKLNFGRLTAALPVIFGIDVKKRSRKK